MFGLENQKKKTKTQEFVFDLEKEVVVPAKRNELLKKVEGKIQKIKEALRTGDAKEDFDKLGVLLQGYVSLAKVLLRIGPKA